MIPLAYTLAEVRAATLRKYPRAFDASEAKTADAGSGGTGDAQHDEDDFDWHRPATTPHVAIEPEYFGRRLSDKGDRSAIAATVIERCRRSGWTPEETFTALMTDVDAPVMDHYGGSESRLRADIERLWKKPPPGDKSAAEAFGPAVAGLAPGDGMVAARPKPNFAKMRFDDWISRTVLPRVPLLGAVWSTTGRLMLIAPTGLGKTHLAMTIAGHVAIGRSFLQWRVERPGRVLYIDGEMPEELMQERLTDLKRRIAPSAAETELLSRNLLIASRENNPDMPPLNSAEGQRFIEDIIADAGPIDGVVFDNVQALTAGNLKDTEAWAVLLPWIKSLTQRRIGQIWVHHANEQGVSYGDKTRTWQFDTEIILKKPEDVDEAADDLIAFDLIFAKARMRTPQNRGDFRPGRMTLQGEVWRFAGTGSGAGPVAEIYDALASAGIRSIAQGWTTLQLAEALIGPQPEAAFADDMAAWNVRVSRKIKSLQKARERNRRLDGFGGEGPGTRRGTTQWLWFLPPVSAEQPEATEGGGYGAPSY